MRTFYCDQFVLPLPAGHRFPMDKYRLLRLQLVAEGVLKPEWLEVPSPAGDEAILRVHSSEYLDRVVGGLLDPAEIRRLGFPWSEDLVERSRRSVGGTMAAAQACLTDGVAVNLAGGTHHAAVDRAAGFCVLNDVAIAARELQAPHQPTPDQPGPDQLAGALPADELPANEWRFAKGRARGSGVGGRVRRVLVVDCDVHQGDGTALIFRDDPTVFTFSIHGRNNFPYRKETSDLDLALADGTGDEAYLEALRAGLEASLDRSRPDVAFYIAGADPFENDRWGRLALSLAGLAARDELVFRSLALASVPAAVVMGGGYARDVTEIVAVHAQTVRLAREVLWRSA